MSKYSTYKVASDHARSLAIQGKAVSLKRDGEGWVVSTIRPMEKQSDQTDSELLWVGIVERVYEWAGFFDRAGPLPIEASARFLVGLAADICFGDPLSPILTPEGFQEFTDMCRKAGVSERATSKLIQSIPY